MKTPCRGLALIIVVGVLGMLAVLAAAFVTMAQLERRASQQRLNATQAALLARSGLEDALARLDLGQTPGYGGEDWDGDGNLSTYEAVQEVYRPTGAGTPADTWNCPVRHALSPSFFVSEPSDPAKKPARAIVDGRDRGLSGILGTDRAGHYALKAAPSGGIYVNGGDPAYGQSVGYNAVLRRILATLALAIDIEDGVAGDGPVVQADGVNLIRRRPQTSRGWEDWEQVRDLALGGSQAKLDVLKPYLTLSAWVDRKVIAPNTPAALTDVAYTSWGAIKSAHTAVVPGSFSPDFERIPQSTTGKIVGRAPVDLAWARTRRPVLIALLAGLKGLGLDESTSQSSLGTDAIGTLRQAEIQFSGVPGGSDECRRVADRILTSTSSLDTWQDWDAFCDAIPDALLSGTTDLRQAKRDILKANFNPNSDLNKFNPDQGMARLVDKSDLLPDGYSTEFNLIPRGGWTLSCVGRLMDAGGCLLASSRISMETVPDSLLRLTTQSEFVAGNLGNPDVAGDESAFRPYGQTPFISLSQGIGKSFGHKLFGQPGLSLQTVPESHPCWMSGSVGPACWDGQIRLATVETADGEFAPVGTKMMFLACFDDGLDADCSGGGGVLTHVADVVNSAPSDSLWKSPAPGQLQPDGIYVERDRQPGYAAAGNMAPSRGTLSFWLKPGYDGTRSNNGGTSRMHLYLNNTRTDGFPANTACFTVVNCGSRSVFQSSAQPMPPMAFGMHWENDYISDEFREQARMTPYPREILKHRWYLLTCFWDCAPELGSGDLSARILVDRGQRTLPDDRNDGQLYCGAISGIPVDFTYQSGDSAVFHLGRRGNDPGTQMLISAWGPPDITFDELAIYDFGTPSSTAINRSETMAGIRFEAGRFYKESTYEGLFAPPGTNKAGEYFSAPIDLGEVHIRALAWTQIVPRGLRAPGGGVKPEDGDPAPDGRIALELVNFAGDTYLQDVEGRDIDTFFTQAEGHGVRRSVQGPFRLHAVFQPNLSVPDTTAILDPLVLDDVSVVYRRELGSRLVAWGEGE